jgi:hypothetical protein
MRRFSQALRLTLFATGPYLAPAALAPVRAGGRVCAAIGKRRWGQQMRFTKGWRLRRGWPLVVLLAACAPAAQTGAEPEAAVAEDLSSALNVRVEDDSVRFELHIMNTTAEAIVLEFPTAQRYDFEVRTAGGRVVWRWSDDMMHAQVLGHEELGPGEAQRYVVVHGRSELAGGDEAHGRLTSSNYPIALRTPIQLAVR